MGGVPGHRDGVTGIVVIYLNDRCSIEAEDPLSRELSHMTVGEIKSVHHHMTSP